MKNKKIRLFKPSIGIEEIESIKKSFNRSWIGYGSKVQEFENKWSKFFNVKHSVGVNSCTAALHIALACNNFKKGKKVLVPSITFSATAAAVLYCGLKPVFVDINEYDLNISFEDLKKKYSKDCVAVMPVHFGGHPCEMEKIVPWAKSKKLIIIEDCAETCGGYYKGKKLGTWGDYGCFSFEEKKIMTTGDGGMVCTNRTENIKSLRAKSFHGWNKDPLTRHKKSFQKKNLNHWDYDIKEIGFKYNMNDLMAAIGIIQFKKLKWLNKTRSYRIRYYLNELKKCKNIIPTFPYKLKNSSYWMLSIRCKKRDKLIAFLKKNGVSTSVHLKPLPLHSLYKTYRKNIKNSEKIWKELITLPLFPDLKIKEIDFIINLLIQFDKSYNKF